MSRVRLGAILALAIAPALLPAAPIFNVSYNASSTFADALGDTTMTLAFDGVNYWSTSGGSTAGNRYAQYTAAGALVGTFAPGLDFRSVFTDAAGEVYARQFNNPTIYKQSSPGVFSSFATLTGGSLDEQSSVVLNSDGTEYIAMSGGNVSRWNLDGTFLGSLALVGFGGAENNYPQGRGIIAAGGYYLTYDNAGLLSAWDTGTGARLDQTTLNGAGTSFNSGFSFSFANGQAWVVDDAGGTWRGYDVGLDSEQAPVPEPGTVGLLACGLGLLVFRKLRK